MIEIIVAILEKAVLVTLPIFVLSFFWLVREVRKHDYKLVKSAVTNPIYPNFSLSFFSKIREEYTKLKGSRFIPIINSVSFFITIFGFLSLFIIVIVLQAVSY